MRHCLKILENFFAKSAVPTFRDKPSPVNLNFYDTMCILIISFFSILIRFYLFYKPYNALSAESPNYLTAENQTFTYSISQPLGNILFSFLTAISINTDGCNSYGDYECKDILLLNNDPNLPQNYIKNNILNLINEDNQVTFREISSLFSAFVPPLLYISIKLASFSRVCAFLSSFLLIFDTSMLYAGRFSNQNVFLHFFVCLTLCFLTYWFSLFRNNEKWKKYMLISSISIGFTVSVKSSAYFLIFIVYFHEFIYLFIENDNKLSNKFLKSFLKRDILFTYPIIIIHIFFYILQFIFTFDKSHFHNLQHQISKSNPSFITNFRFILSNCAYKHQIQPTNHKKPPSPASWIFITKLDNYLWSNCNRNNNNKCEYVVSIGNLFIYIFAFLGVILVILAKDNRKYFRSSTFYLGYVFSFITCLILNKFNVDLNSSDYLISFIFGVACFGISIDILASRSIKGFLCVVSISLAIVGFNIWAPLVFAEKLSKHSLGLRIWLKAWERNLQLK